MNLNKKNIQVVCMHHVVLYAASIHIDTHRHLLGAYMHTCMRMQH
jgi:hypothetical protein